MAEFPYFFCHFILIFSKIRLTMEILERILSFSKYFPDLDRDLILLAISNKQKSYLDNRSKRRLKEKYIIIDQTYQTLEFFGDKVLSSITVSHLLDLFSLSKTLKNYHHYFQEFVRNSNLTKLSIDLGFYDELFPDADISSKHNTCSDVIESILGALFVQYGPCKIEIIGKWFFNLDIVIQNINKILESEIHSETEFLDSEAENFGAFELEEELQDSKSPTPRIELQMTRSETLLPKIEEVKPIEINPTKNSEENIELFRQVVKIDKKRWRINKDKLDLIRVTKSLFSREDEVPKFLMKFQDEIRILTYERRNREDVSLQIRYLNNIDLSPVERLRGVLSHGRMNLYSQLFGRDIYGFYWDSRDAEYCIVASFCRENFEKNINHYALIAASSFLFGDKLNFFKHENVNFLDQIPFVLPYKFNIRLIGINFEKSDDKVRGLPSSILYNLRTMSFTLIEGGKTKIPSVGNVYNALRPVTLADAIREIQMIFDNIEKYQQDTPNLTAKIKTFYETPKYYEKFFGIKGKAFGLRVLKADCVEELLLSFITTDECNDNDSIKGILAFQALTNLKSFAGVNYPEIGRLRIPLSPSMYDTENLVEEIYYSWSKELNQKK